ncbi:MAG TPA: hypothetical protein VMG10_17665 [Gemmataceae bacterium]|nr:hypothetical protein [Gemmataceae bacterium]
MRSPGEALSSALPFFGVRRFSAAFFLSVFNKQQAKQSGGKAPHSKIG